MLVIRKHKAVWTQGNQDLFFQNQVYREVKGQQSCPTNIGV